MRYKLDANGYIDSVAFGCYLEDCNEYTGTVPTGYSDLNDWATNAYINAYYIKDGNLVLDEEKLAEIQEKEVQDAIDNTPVLRKDIFGSEQVLGSQYIRETATGEVIKIENIQTVAPKVKITGIQPSEYTKLNIYTNGSNMMPLNDINKTISGVTISKHSNGWLIVSGKATEEIELTIAGSDTNTEPLFALKKNHKYSVGLGDYEYELRYFDGETTSQVYVGSSTELNLSESAKVTQVVIKIPTSDMFASKAFLPLLEYESKIGDTYRRKTLSIDFSSYIESDDTTVEYILLEGGYVRASINGVERIIGTGTLGLHSDCSTIYALEDTSIEIEYCTNVYDVENLKFLQGKATTSNGFMVTEDGGVIATMGKIGGWTLDDTSIKSEKIVSYIPPNGDDLATIKKYILGEVTLTSAQKDYYDINGDGVVDIKDAYILNKVFRGEVEYSDYPNAKQSTLNVIINPIDGVKTIKITGTDFLGRAVEASTGGTLHKAPVIKGNYVYGGTVEGGSVVTTSGANLDTINTRTTWKSCTATAQSAYGAFNTMPYVKARYDNAILEIEVIYGTWWSSVAAVAEGQALFRITGLPVAIPHESTCQVWDDSAQIYRRLRLEADGYVKLASNASIPKNYWLSIDNVRFVMRRS